MCECDWQDNFWFQHIGVAMEAGESAERFRRDLQDPRSRLHQWVANQQCPEQVSVFLWNQEGKQFGFDVKGVVSLNNEAYKPENRRLISSVCLPGNLLLHFWCAHRFLLVGHLAQPAQSEAVWQQLRGWWHHMRAIRDILVPEIAACLSRAPWPLAEQGGLVKQWVEGWIGDVNSTAEPRLAFEPTTGRVDVNAMVYNGTLTHRRRGIVPKVRTCLPLKNAGSCWPMHAQFTTESCSHCCDPSKGPYGDEACWRDGRRSFQACCQQDYKGVRCEEHRKEEPGCLDCPSSLSFFCEEEHKYWMIKAWHALNQTIYSYNDWLNITRNHTLKLEEATNNVTMAVHAYNHSARALVRSSARIARLLAVPDKAWVEGEILARTRHLEEKLNVTLLETKSNLTEARKNESDSLHRLNFANFKFSEANKTYFVQVNRLDTIAKREDEIYDLLPMIENNITVARHNRSIAQSELDTILPLYTNFTSVMADISVSLNESSSALAKINADIAVVDEDLKDLLDHERASARLKVIVNETNAKLLIKANYTAEFKTVNGALTAALKACDTANSSRVAESALCSQLTAAEDALVVAGRSLDGAVRNATKTNGLWRRAKKFDNMFMSNMTDYKVQLKMHVAAFTEERELNGTLADLYARHKTEKEVKEHDEAVLFNATANVTALTTLRAEISHEISTAEKVMTELTDLINRSGKALARAQSERTKFTADLADSKIRRDERRAELELAKGVEDEALAALVPLKQRISDLRKQLSTGEATLMEKLRVLAGERNVAAAAVKRAREIFDERRRAQEAAYPWMPTAAWRAMDWVALNAEVSSDDENFRRGRAAVAAVEAAEAAVAQAEVGTTAVEAEIGNLKREIDDFEAKLSAAWKATRPARDAAKMRRVVYEASETGVAVLGENLQRRVSEVARLEISIPADKANLTTTSERHGNLTHAEFPRVDAALQEAVVVQTSAHATWEATVARVEELELEIADKERLRDVVNEARLSTEMSLREYTPEIFRMRFPVIASLESEARRANESLSTETRKFETTTEWLNRTRSSKRKLEEEISVADLLCANVSLHQSQSKSWKNQLDQISSDLYWLEQDERTQLAILNQTALENLDQEKFARRVELLARASEMKSIISLGRARQNATETENAEILQKFKQLNETVTTLEISEWRGRAKIAELMEELTTFKDERKSNADDIRRAQRVFAETRKNVTRAEEELEILKDESMRWETRLNATGARKSHAERRLLEAKTLREKVDTFLNFNATAGEYRTWSAVHMERAAMLNWTRGNFSEQEEVLKNSTRKVEELYKEYVNTEKYFYQKEAEWKDYERRVTEGLEEKLDFVHEL
jgi:hypothetical protein